MLGTKKKKHFSDFKVYLGISKHKSECQWKKPSEIVFSTNVNTLICPKLTFHYSLNVYQSFIKSFSVEDYIILKRNLKCDKFLMWKCCVVAILIRPVVFVCATFDYTI